MSLSATFVLSSTMITCPVIAFLSTRIVFPSPTLLRRGIDRYLTFSFRHEFHKTKLQYSFFKAVVPSIFTRPPIYADTLSRANRSIPLHSTYSNFKGSTSPAVMARKTVERFPRVHAPRRASLGASRRLYLARLVSTLCHPSERSSVDSWHHFDSASRSAIVRSRVSVLPRHCCLDHASSSLSSVSLHFRRPIPLRQEELLFAPQTTCGVFFFVTIKRIVPFGFDHPTVGSLSYYIFKDCAWNYLFLSARDTTIAHFAFPYSPYSFFDLSVNISFCFVTSVSKYYIIHKVTWQNTIHPFQVTNQM